MSSQKILKGDCQHCGGRIEFLGEMAGTTTECPHCKQPTELLLTAPQQPPALPVRTVIYTVLAVVILAGGLVAAMIALKRAQSVAERSNAASSSASAKKAQAALPPGTILKDGFRISAISLEKTPGSSLIHAVGTVRNETARRRFGIKVELDVFGGDGGKVGTAEVYQQVLEPKAEWRFKALVVGSKAAAAKLTLITEDK